MKSMRASRSRLSIVTVTFVLALTTVLASASMVAAKKPWELIKWNEPVPWPDRLMADRYILPEGWKEATKGVTQITFFNSGGLAYDIATVMNMRRFEELTGIKVNAIPVAADLLFPKGLSTLVAKDLTVDAVCSNDPAEDLTSFASGGWLEPVDHMYPPEVLELYNPDIKNLFSWDNHWWVLPVTAIGHIEFYRPSWLKNTGLSVPDTWEDYYEAAKKVNSWAKQSLGKDYYGMVINGGDRGIIIMYREMLMNQGKKLFENGKYQFESPEGRKAFKMMVDFVKEGIAPPDSLNFAWGDVGTFFGVGKSGFMSAMQPSYITVYTNQFPQIAKDFDVFAPPKWSAGDPEEWRGRSVIGCNSMLINKAVNDNQKAAVMLFFDFIRSKEGQRHELIVEGNESVMMSIWDNPDAEIDKVDWDLANRVADELNIPHPMKPSTVRAQDIRGMQIRNSVFEVYPPGFIEVINKFVQEYGKAALGEIATDQALKNIQTLADELTP